MILLGVIKISDSNLWGFFLKWLLFINMQRQQLSVICQQLKDVLMRKLF